MSYPSTKTLASDLLVFGLLGLFSFLAGLGVNQIRHQPLSLDYAPPEARLEKDVQQLLTQQPSQTLPAELSSISLVELKKRIESNDVLLLDARAKVFYDLGHLPGALSLPRNDFLRAFKENKKAIDSTVGNILVVYCSGGTCEDSVLVVKALNRLGYDKVLVYAGGWQEWSASK